MMKIAIVYLLVLFASGSLPVFAASKTPVKNASAPSDRILNGSLPAPAAQPEKTIIFFMNPFGAPCQMQDWILRGMASEIRTKAFVKYYKTTESADREQFFKYGIRGLPAMIIIDQDNQVIHRFTPGIQPKKVILSALAQK